MDPGCGQPASPGQGAAPQLTTAAPYPGLLCHLNDACISNPCNEGSNCDTNPVNGKAICTCPSGYTGPACSQDVDECSLGTGSRGGSQGAGKPGGNSLMEEAGTPQSVLEARAPGAAPHCAVPAHPQAPTPVSTRASASTRWAPSSASVCRATPARAARSTSTSVCRTRVRTTPPAWTRSGSSSASACPVRGAPPDGRGWGSRVRADGPQRAPRPHLLCPPASVLTQAAAPAGIWGDRARPVGHGGETRAGQLGQPRGAGVGGGVPSPRLW